jgi:hypothetical protein
MKLNNKNGVCRTIIKKSKDNPKKLSAFTGFLLVMTILAGCSQLTGDDSKQTVAKPAAEPAAGTVALNQRITLSCETGGADIYYTLDGSEPSSSGTKYAEDNKPQITSAGTTTVLKAVAVKAGMTDSDVLTAEYTVDIQKVATSAADPEGGMYYSSAPSITLDCDTTGADIYYTTDGSVPSDVNGTKYTAPFTLDSFPGTLKAIAVKDGMNPSEILTMVYTDELVGQILLLDEKDNFGTEGRPPARYFRDEIRPADDLNQIKWVPGHEGQGIDLDDGHFKTHIRFVGPAFGKEYYNNFQDHEALTLSTWVYWRGAGLSADNTTYAPDENGQCLLGMSGSAGFLKVSINDSPAGGLVFAAGLYDADISCEPDPAVPVPKNQWIMVTVTLDGTTMKLYFNGQKIGETANTAAVKEFGCDLFRLGSNFWGPPTCNAIFDQTSIWSRVLSETVIAALYNNTK